MKLSIVLLIQIELLRIRLIACQLFFLLTFNKPYLYDNMIGRNLPDVRLNSDFYYFCRFLKIRLQ